ncbi:MAG: class I adenylate-forming enzyme family protein [Armatimonadota bacterium]|nr:class I adenylate-forming enzyme family protein [Armatimonadota bacterium]
MRGGTSLLDEAFRKVARDQAEHTAMVYLGERYRFRDLEDLVDRLARGLERLGVEAGERVLLYMPHCPQWVVTWLALRRRSAVAVPVSPQYGPRDVAYVARDAGASVLFCADTLFGYAARVQQEAGLRCVVVTGIGDLLPWWKRAVGKALDRLPAGRVRLSGTVFTFRELLAGSTRARRPSEPAEGAEGAEGLCELLYTGGTLGHPKGVPISEPALLESMQIQRETSLGAVPLGSDVVIQGAALYHILGQAQGLGALLAGETLVLLPRMNWDAFLDHIQRYRVTTLFGTPTLYRTILEHPRLDAYDLRSLRYCFSAGDALPPDMSRRWKARFGLEIHQGYGATEACGAISMTPAGQPFPEGTVGRVVRGREVRIVDPETLRPCSPGEPGELLVSGPHLPTAYWNRAEETRRAFPTYEGRVWYRTGDILRMDTDGWLYFVDRSADLIKKRGYRVAPARVESVLQEHPAVIAACAVGVPDAEVGERIKAFVVLKEDLRGISAYELLRWCRERLAPYEVPDYIEFRDMLPKSKVGKLLRRELREEERRKWEQAMRVR